MKRDQQKKSKSKLKLNKETLKNLTTDQLQAVRGGLGKGVTSGNPVICGDQSNLDQGQCP